MRFRAEVSTVIETEAKDVYEARKIILEVINKIVEDSEGEIRMDSISIHPLEEGE